MSNIVQGPWQKLQSIRGPQGLTGPSGLNGPPSLTSDQIAMLLEPAIQALEKQQNRDELIFKIGNIILTIFAMVVGIFIIIVLFITALNLP